ncbi:glycosyltransferase family 4 protein [Micromonospora sp. URMC 103]|uniref:glycosyltransferase family 4 protein n=1 Tax=Micromonospora sp. URMC 103 TaxID=3423406 RepID=UPI003F1C8407
MSHDACPPTTDPATGVDPGPPARPCRLLRVVGELNFGGTELRIVDLLPRLAAAGVEPHFVTLSDRIGPGPLAAAVRRYGGTVRPVPLDARLPGRFLRLLRDLRPDVLHADCANFSGALLALAALAGVPTRVAHFRSDDNQHRGARRRAQRWVLGRLLQASATDILGVSPSALTFGYRPSWEADPRCRVVLNGLDLDRLRRPSEIDLRVAVGAAPGELLCLTVGRASPEKRRWLLPPIVAELRDRGIPAHAVLVGPSDPADDARVRAAAAEAGVPDRVHLFGPRDDVGGLLSQADVVVHPSLLEGLPGSVLEPVALGVPTVAADLPGVRYISEHLPGVVIVDTEAPAARWAEAVRRAVEDRAGLDRAEATERFARSIFSLDAAAEVHLALYRRQPARRQPAADVPARNESRTYVGSDR